MEGNNFLPPPLLAVTFSSGHSGPQFVWLKLRGWLKVFLTNSTTGPHQLTPWTLWITSLCPFSPHSVFAVPESIWIVWYSLVDDQTEKWIKSRNQTQQHNSYDPYNDLQSIYLIHCTIYASRTSTLWSIICKLQRPHLPLMSKRMSVFKTLADEVNSYVLSEKREELNMNKLQIANN